MPSSRRDYPSSMYPEHGSGDGSSNYSQSSRSNRRSKSGGDGYDARRSTRRSGYIPHSYDDSHDDNSESSFDGNGYRRGLDDRRRGDRDERHSRDRDSSKRDSRRDDDRDRNHDRDRSYDRNPDKDHIEKKGRSSSLGFLERALPRDFRPSHADPEARLHRLQKEKNCDGFDWTPGLVLGLIGATMLFNHERSLVKRKKKEYFD
ncbi:hypothetical protein MKX08_004407 [Trichoderma sp. CBMAI-0020]|nr:hypothetical protein MKX08_004407 [Trichoderma sp. CBMAI-0020]